MILSKWVMVGWAFYSLHFPIFLGTIFFCVPDTAVLAIAAVVPLFYVCVLLGLRFLKKRIIL
jgi:hypothetical protein